MTANSDEALVCTSGQASVTVDLLHGGRLGSLRVHGYELLARCGPSPMEWGCFVMAPFAGRLDRGRIRIGDRVHQLPTNAPPHAIHGTVVDAPAEVIGPAAVRLDLGPDWPARGHVVHAIDLEHDRMTLRLEVHSEEHSFPASCGWHPWFPRRLGNAYDVVVTVSAGSMLARGEDGLPDGRRIAPPPRGPWDDCFETIRSPTMLEWPGVLKLSIESDASHLVVYDERPDAVCIEPQTSPPNDLAAVVEPGSPLVATTTWTWAVA